MKPLILTLILFATSAFAQNEPNLLGSKWYWSSVSAMAGSSTFDAETSQVLNKFASAAGIHETNPILANSQGQFVPQRGIAAKIIVLAATVGCERAMLYLVRKQGANPARMEKAFGWINIGFAAGYTGIAAHNMTLH